VADRQRSSQTLLSSMAVGMLNKVTYKAKQSVTETFSPSGIVLLRITEFLFDILKINVLEAGSVSIGERVGRTYSVGSIRRS
jgi:hypothetical protein